MLKLFSIMIHNYRKKILELLAMSTPPLSEKRLAKLLGLSKTTPAVRVALSDLEGEGLITRGGPSHSKVLWWAT